MQVWIVYRELEDGGKKILRVVASEEKAKEISSNEYWFASYEVWDVD